MTLLCVQLYKSKVWSQEKEREKKMGKKTLFSEFVHLLIVLLLICTLLCRTESTLPSHHDSLIITGRRLMDNIDPRHSVSGQAGGRISDPKDLDSPTPQ
ncbi:unnamed protein product [Thlaspi arvense]|uniref:Uncharacterized protein n=1 Tax=Thlaspi arvense TaxID=13288 RepID=A0AAU9RRB6_THLAR|nr:unnamed protein product [Thlaspi arvense]